MDYKEFVSPGDNSITLSVDLANDIKEKFEQDRKNRFDLFLLTFGIRQKYFDTTTERYTDEFSAWYKESKLDDFYGSFANFTKYALAGEVVSWVSSKMDPNRYLPQLPLSVGALYELSMVLRQDEKLFRRCLQFTPSRKSVDTPDYEIKDKKPALIQKNVTELKVHTWLKKWNNPPQPKPRRNDKRTLPLVTITCSGELYDFDRKTGDKVGCLDLPEVEELVNKLQALFEANDPRFKVTSHLDDLEKGYYKRKASYEITRNIKKGKSDRSERYT